MTARVLLFTGKGGVGKTTTAAATAVRAARQGLKTLVMSTDSAHSLADALGVAPSGEPGEVEPGLSALQVDARARAARSWGGIQRYLVDLLSAAGLDPVAAEELAVLPGAEEVLALTELRDQVVSGPWDLVVVDCAPTAETLRLLATPQILTWATQRLVPVGPLLLRAVRPALGRVSGVPVPGTGALEALARLQAELAGVQEVLSSPSTSVRLVLTPEAVVLAEARRTLTSLSVYGYAVDGVVANRVIPTGADPWRAGWAQRQAAVLDQVRLSFVDLPLWLAAYRDEEPVGPDALALVAQDLYAESDGQPWDESSRRAPMRVERSGDGFRLEVDLPLATATDVDLDRIGDDLWLGVAGHRRVVALPGALRRCDVTGAAVRDGVLRVQFEPDPDQWRAL